MRKSPFIVFTVFIMIAALCMGAYANPRNSSQTKPDKKQSIQKRNNTRSQRFEKRPIMSRTRLASVQGILLPPRPAAINEMAKRLQLTQDQEKQISDLTRRFYKRMKPVLRSRAKAMQSVRKLLASPKLSESTLSAIVAKVEKDDKLLVNAEISYWGSLKKVLTPQQQSAFMNTHMKIPQKDKAMHKMDGKGTKPSSK